MAKKNPPQKVAIRNNVATASAGGKPKAAPPRKSKNLTRKMAKTTITVKPKTKQERAPFIVSEAPPPVFLQPKPVVDEVSYAPKAIPHGAPLSVTVQSAQGTAANGNAHPANLLVVVTCAGWPVTELSKDHFTLMEHFEVPGQTAPLQQQHHFLPKRRNRRLPSPDSPHQRCALAQWASPGPDSHFDRPRPAGTGRFQADYSLKCGQEWF